MESTRHVRPLNPVAPYIGGKRNLAERLVARIEAVPHKQYAEVFVGMGGVFLRRRFVPKAEIINDRSREVSTLFRVLQRHYVAFLDMMKFQLTTRAEFERLVATDPDTLTDLERAARFLFLQRISYAGKVAGRTFGVESGAAGRFNITRLGPLLEELHSRLAAVTIECLDFREFIPRYDTPDTLFYLDPPYYGSEGYYGKELFARADFTDLRQALDQMEGRFILSINDVPATRRLFEGLEVEAVETTYSAQQSGNNPVVGELIVSNVPLDDGSFQF